jgi:hypothetical protein
MRPGTRLLLGAGPAAGAGTAGYLGLVASAVTVDLGMAPR